MKKRILALALALVCLVSAVFTLSACADKDDEKPNTNVDVKPELDHLNGLDFGGEYVSFAIAGGDGDDFNQRSIYVDEEGDDGDAVNSAIYARNQKIQTMLNVEFDIATDADASITSQIKPILLGGTSDYDIIAARQYDDIQLALEGVILDLNTLADYDADYIKWDREYWATSYIDALTFGNKSFWLTGDLCMRYTGGYYAMFINTRLYNDILANEFGSIYDIVNNKQWTYAKLMDMVSKCYEDTNGDDKVDIEGDRLGLALPVWDNTNGMAISAGVIFTRYDENGTPANNTTNGNRTLLDFLEQHHNLIQTEGVYTFGGDYKKAMEIFAAGQSVFVAGRLNQAELYLRDMVDDYYVIPCPMLNEEQGAYYTGVHDAINIYGINYSSEKIAAAAATLEAMAYESYYTVRPIYYDSFLKFKYTRDDQAATMIDLMHDNVYTDFVFIWQFSEDMSKLGSFLRNNVINANGASSLKKMQASWTKGVETILEKIEAIE